MRRSSAANQHTTACKPTTYSVSAMQTSPRRSAKGSHRTQTTYPKTATHVCAFSSKRNGDHSFLIPRPPSRFQHLRFPPQSLHLGGAYDKGYSHQQQRLCHATRTKWEQDAQRRWQQGAQRPQRVGQVDDQSYCHQQQRWRSNAAQRWEQHALRWWEQGVL